MCFVLHVLFKLPASASFTARVCWSSRRFREPLSHKSVVCFKLCSSATRAMDHLRTPMQP
jgi:hypothetical protein